MWQRFRREDWLNSGQESLHCSNSLHEHLPQVSMRIFHPRAASAPRWLSSTEDLSNWVTLVVNESNDTQTHNFYPTWTLKHKPTASSGARQSCILQGRKVNTCVDVTDRMCLPPVWLLPEEFSKVISTIQQVPYTRTSKLWTFRDGNVHLVPARNQNLCHPRQAWVKLQLALRLLLLTILQLYHLPPPLPPPVSISSCLFTRCQPLCASCCTALLYFSRDCTVRLKMFSWFFLCVCFWCIICMKSIINLLQYGTI